PSNPRDFCEQVALAPDGKTLAATCGNAVVVWDVASGQELAALPQPADIKLHALVFSPDGKLLASGSDDGTLCLWDVDARKQLYRLRVGEKQYVTAVAFADGARTVLAAGEDGVRSWNTATGKESGALKVQALATSAMAVTADGRRLATVSNGVVRLWDRASGEQLH